MALITVLDEDGKPHLIHTSMISPGPRKPDPQGDWADVWAKVEAEEVEDLQEREGEG